MADFWIKVEKGTPDKPEVLEIASILGIEDPDTVTGKLIRVWSWFDSNSSNGHAPSVTNVLLDRVTGVQGFCEALISVGWLVKSDTDVFIPNFDRHLGQSAKKRALDSERKRKSREMSRKEPDSNETKSGPEKSREEENKDTVDNPPAKQAKTPACPYQKIADLYNEKIGDDFPKIRGLTTAKRQGIAKKLFSNMDRDLEKVEAYFEFFAENAGPFYRGHNDRNWVANFDYIAKEDTIEKAREGNL